MIQSLKFDSILINLKLLTKILPLFCRCTFCPKNCDESCLRIKPSIASNACSPTQVQTLFKVLWITCHSPRHCTASPICKYHNFQKENRIFIATHQKSRRIFHILLLYQTTAKKTIAEREKKYNQIKIRRPSETLCENFKHYEYEKKKVKNNYSRVRKRRPRKILLLSHKKLHLSTLKYKNTNSMDKKERK